MIVFWPLVEKVFRAFPDLKVPIQQWKMIYKGPAEVYDKKNVIVSILLFYDFHR